MFDWIVEAVNLQLAKEHESLCLGVLDIYGFEIFEVGARARTHGRQRARLTAVGVRTPRWCAAVAPEKRVRAVLHQLRQREAAADLH